MRYATQSRLPWLAGACFALMFVGVQAHAQGSTVSGKVEAEKPAGKKPSGAPVYPAPDAVVWLSALGEDAAAPVKPSRSPQLIQRNKTFEPHVLVVEVGSVVQFPNKDPFFHNVFSLFDGKRFDLGLYEAGSSNSVRFDRPGISYLFCNIHPEMSAVVVAVPTAWFAVSDASGRWSIPNIRDGRYRLHVWYERSSMEDLGKLERDVLLPESAGSLDTIRVVDSGVPTAAHKNKFGKDYIPASSPAYTNP